jgi:hypothetical protein
MPAAKKINTQGTFEAHLTLTEPVHFIEPKHNAKNQITSATAL